MTLLETLVSIGMEEKEAKIYLAGLELGRATVLQLSKKSEVKRPTTYVLLDEMCQKGYFAKTVIGEKPLYIAERPSTLVQSAREKERSLTESLPLLEAMSATAKERPKISIYEGKSGVRQVYAQLLESEEILFFGSIREINRHFSETVKEVVRASRRKKPVVRDILTDLPEDRVFAREVMKENSKYQVRVAPAGIHFGSDCAIYGDRIAIFAVRDDFFAVVIQSSEVANSFRAIHALAWQSAKEIR